MGRSKQNKNIHPSELPSLTAYQSTIRGPGVRHYTDECEKHEHLSMKEIELIMRTKMIGGARSFTVQAQKGYAGFGRPRQGISKPSFVKRLREWGGEARPKHHATLTTVLVQ